MGADENAQALIYTEESGNILRKLNLKSFESDYKVMIIWLPEKMKTECSNKLLKILEEPYPNTLFLLVTEHAEEIITTILSRTQTDQGTPSDPRKHSETTGSSKTLGPGLSRSSRSRGIR